jgi:hypothetical protein
VTIAEAIRRLQETREPASLGNVTWTIEGDEEGREIAIARSANGEPVAFMRSDDLRDFIRRTEVSP